MPLKRILSSALFFYLLVAVFILVAVDYKRVASHSWPKTLSRLRVPYSYLIEAANGVRQDRAKFIDGMRYFNAIARIYGDRADTNAFIVVSAYYLGEISLARKYCLKLKDSAPGFFWGYYNLAVLSYIDRDYSSVIDYCQKAFGAPVDKSVAFMMTNKVYQPLFVENGITPQILVRNIEHGRLILLKLLIASKSESSSLSEEILPIRAF